MAVAIESGSQGSAASSSSVATIASLDFNAEASDRIICACIAVEDADTITGVTIGGETAGLLKADVGVGSRRAEIWSANVPTGTSGSVVVTVSAGDTTVSVATFSVTGADATPTDTDSANGNGVDISIAALTIPTDGAGLCCHCNGFGGVVAWTGATESHDTSIGSFNHSSAIVTTAGTNTITADGQNTAQSLVGVAFGPAAGGAATSLVPPVNPLPPAMFDTQQWHPQMSAQQMIFSYAAAPPAATSLIYRPTFMDHMLIR